jgi:hypothetical protein
VLGALLGSLIVAGLILRLAVAPASTRPGVSLTAATRAKHVTAATSDRFLWGVSEEGTQFTTVGPPWNWQAVTDFERIDAGGKALSVLGWGSPFYAAGWCTGYCQFPTSAFQTVRSHGAIPFLTWTSTNGLATDHSTQPTAGYTDAEIALGSQDAYIAQWARAAKAWGHPLFLRFDPEMNGNWNSWDAATNAQAATFVAMWRHVHDIFTEVGAENVSWVWCPNIDPRHAFESMARLYPGNAYVDWTCLDGYNGDDPWRSFYNTFSTSYAIVSAIAPSKPMMIGETGSTERGGSKAAWIGGMFSALEHDFPRIHALLWWEAHVVGPGGHTDWPIESSGTSEAAFTRGIRSSAFVSNRYASLNDPPIPPPATTAHHS